MWRCARAVSLVAAAVAALAACGEPASEEADADAGVDGAVVNVDATALCGAPDGVLVQLRARLAACAPDRADALDDAGYEALCRASIEPYLRDGTMAIGDDAALAACAAHVATAACADLSAVRLGPCAAVLVGRQAAGAACEQDAQCAANGYCATGDGCGACRSRAADGAACDRHAACASGRCAAGACAAPAASGEACVDDGDCAGALRCLGGACSAATGTELDAPCDVTLEACAPETTGRFCESTDALTDTGTCRPFAARGAACVALGTRPGPWCNWTAYDRCVDGVCVEAAPVAAGGACDPEAPCAPELVCREAVPGEAPTCAVPVAAGGACGDPEACAAPLSCVAGRCQLGPYTGACPAR